MQLNRDIPVRGVLTALTAALLGHSGVASAEPIHADASFLVYSESERVTAGEAMFRFRRQMTESYGLGLNIQVDALSGASPSGATPSKEPQTFTSPSGNSNYIVDPGEIPLDPSFRDSRVAVDGELTRALNRTTSLTLGGRGSFEYDYTSFGISSGITRIRRSGFRDRMRVMSPSLSAVRAHPSHQWCSHPCEEFPAVLHMQRTVTTGPRQDTNRRMSMTLSWVSVRRSIAKR